MSVGKKKVCSWAWTSDSFHMEMGFKIYSHISPSMQSHSHILFAYMGIWQLYCRYQILYTAGLWLSLSLQGCEQYLSPYTIRVCVCFFLLCHTKMFRIIKYILIPDKDNIPFL